MAANYHRVCDEIYDQLYNRLERKKDEKYRFAAKGTVAKVLHDANLNLLFQTLVPENGAQEEWVEIMTQITAQSFIERVKERQLHDFLAILIFASCSLPAARAFVLKLIAPDQWPILDRKETPISSLPANLLQLFDIFHSNVDADKFHSKQACFCPVVLRKREEVKVESLTKQRLPYLDEKPIGEGSFGKVFEVKIAAGYFEDPNAGFGHNTEPILLARKDYTLTNREKVREEHVIMIKILQHSYTRCENIVESFGSISIGDNFSLFMPCAVCDLREYMMKFSNPPNSKEAKAEMLLCAQGLADGLIFLHHGMTTPASDDMVCYHMDLTLKNILVFSETQGESSRMIWKLSDFGMARIKIRRRGQGEQEWDLKSLFVPRRINQPLLSGTMNRRGEGTYLAPESMDPSPQMRTGSDVWSLGCVLSVVFTYLDDGLRGVTAYQDARLKFRDAHGYDRFFIPSQNFIPTRTHPVVREWHKELIRQAEQRDAREGKAFRYMLKHLEESVLLIDQAQRSNAKQVKEMIAETYEIYKNREDEENENSDQSTAHKYPFWSKFFQPKRRCTAQEWLLTSAESFNGCAISPDAACVAYWTNHKIFIYTSQSLTLGDGPKDSSKLIPVTNYSLPENHCSWKSVTLTNEYLIASTTERSYCYIFDLQAGPAIDCNLVNPDRIALPFPEITRLAISSDSQTLACVLRHEDGDRHPGSLLYVSLSDLISVARSQSSISGEDISAIETGRRGSLGTPWKTVNILWPAADVVQLIISDDQDVHLVIRPELTARSREHKIHIMHLSLRQSTNQHIITIKPRGFDSRCTTGFFTTFSPLRDANTCAVITNEKHIIFQTFDGVDLTFKHQQDVHYHILKFLTGQNDNNQLFALGTTSTDNRIKLLKIEMPPLPGHLVVREVAHFPSLYYGDDFVGVLSDENGKKIVLVATLLGANGRRLCKVVIPDEPDKGAG